MRRSSLSTLRTVSSRWVSSVSVWIGVVRAVARDLGVVAEERALVALRLQLDVLLADRGAVADERVGVGGDVVELVVDVEHDVDAVVGEDELAHLADPHTAVGDLRALEGAAGVGEVRDHGVALVEHEPVEAGVAGADEADSHQRDEGEDQQLHLGPTGDHRSTTIPGTSRLTRAGSYIWLSWPTWVRAAASGGSSVRRRAGQAGQGERRQARDRERRQGRGRQREGRGAGAAAEARDRGLLAAHAAITEPGRPRQAVTSPRRMPSRHSLIASRASWHSRLVSGSGPSCGSWLSGMQASVGSVVGIVVGIDGEVDVEGDRQVGVVAHVQVARHLRVAADDLVDERVGEEDVEGVGEVVAGRGELGQHRVEPLERGDRGALRLRDHVDRDDGEVVERGEHLDEVVALAVDRVERAGQLLERLVDRRAAASPRRSRAG